MMRIVNPHPMNSKQRMSQLCGIILCSISYILPSMGIHEYQLKTTDSDTLLVRGHVREQFYESKKGIVTDLKEYYFIPAAKERKRFKLEKEYFIKLWEGKILREALLTFLEKKISVYGIFAFGLWDATGEQHASRIGNYVAIFEISKN